MKVDFSDAIIFIGAAMILAGTFMINRWAVLIVAGAFLLFLGIKLGSRPTGERGPYIR